MRTIVIDEQPTVLELTPGVPAAVTVRAHVEGDDTTRTELTLTLRVAASDPGVSIEPADVAVPVVVVRHGEQPTLMLGAVDVPDGLTVHVTDDPLTLQVTAA